MLIPKVKVEEFEKFGFKKCKGEYGKSGCYYLCVSRGCKMLFVSPKIFDVNEWKRNDPRIHKDANCRYRDHRTYLDIIYELIKADIQSLRAEQSRAEQSRLALTEQFVNREEEKLQTASRQDMTQESATCGQMETVLLKDQGATLDKQIYIATTLRARDYKGFDNYGSNGVIEWK